MLRDGCKSCSLCPPHLSQILDCNALCIVLILIFYFYIVCVIPIIDCVWGLSQAIRLRHINKVFYLSVCLFVCLSIYLSSIYLAS